MKKFLATALAVILAVSVFTGCGKKKTEEKKPEGTKTEEQTKLKVGFVSDQGGINDKSFNQLAWEGTQRAAKELGIEKNNPLESKQVEQYQPNLKTMASNSDLTVGAGFMMAEAMTEAAKQMPDKKFAIVDASIDSPNVLSLLFKDQEGAFLVGVVAGRMTKTNKVGFIGGVEGPVINRFESGFVAGVTAVNPEAGKGLMPIDEKTPGKTVKYIDSFDNVGKAKEAAKMLYNDGCDIIFHAAGGAGNGLFEAAKEMKKYAIGVDADQAQTVPDAKDVILCSDQKKVDIAVYDAIKSLKEGKFEGGKTMNLGIKEDGVDIAPTINPAVPKEVMDEVAKYKEAIKTDKFVVPGTRKELMNYKAPQL